VELRHHILGKHQQTHCTRVASDITDP
jgi:hypothetical protein